MASCACCDHADRAAPAAGLFTDYAKNAWRYRYGELADPAQRREDRLRHIKPRRDSRPEREGRRIRPATAQDSARTIAALQTRGLT